MLCFCWVGNLKAQVTDAERYWIKENFATFVAEEDNHDSTYVTYPNQVPLTTTMTYVLDYVDDGSIGQCGSDTALSKMCLKVDGFDKDDPNFYGSVSFTVDNADIVTIDIRAKSTKANRKACVYRDGELVKIFEGLDLNHCVTFTDSVYRNATVTYSVRGDSATTNTNPILVYGIEVVKYNAPNPDDTLYTITATADANGTITPSGEVRVKKGENQTFVIKATEGYKISVVLVDDAVVQLTDDSLYTFENVSGDHTITVATVTSVSNITGNHRLHIYPNPATDCLWIRNDNGETIQNVEVYNITGQMVQSRTGNSETTQQVNLKNVPEGLYLIKIITSKQTVVYKFIKQ